MRRTLLALLSALALSGCVSTLQSMYDNRAHDDCDDVSGSSARSSCHDRVDQNARERR
jgi:hypothetical protein